MYWEKFYIGNGIIGAQVSTRTGIALAQDNKSICIT